jgi:hypothetical protein
MKLGRKPRGHDLRIPKLAALPRTSVAAPVEVDYMSGLPSSLGAMLNDELGDCTCAAAGHAIQLWTFNTASMVTPPDSAIEELYEEAGGYVPGDPSTDNGCVEQEVLTDWLNDPIAGNELTAFVEVDQTNMTDVEQTIWECGLIYIGFNVPAYLMNRLTGAGAVWDVARPGDDTTIVGGHAVVVAGYNVSGNMPLISWGNPYSMTPAFWAQYVDECYGLVNKDWVATTGKTPAGLSLTDLETLMQSLRFSPPSGDRRQHRRRKRHRAAGMVD